MHTCNDLMKFARFRVSSQFLFTSLISDRNITCAKVMEMFSFFFLAAKIREETSSEALEQRGVTTNDTQNAKKPEHKTQHLLQLNVTRVESNRFIIEIYNLIIINLEKSPRNIFRVNFTSSWKQDYKLVHLSQYKTQKVKLSIHSRLNFRLVQKPSMTLI